MREEDTAILKEIQKNTSMGLKAIHVLSEKVMDEEISRQLDRQSVKYGELNNRAAKKLVDADAEQYRGSKLQDMMLNASIEASTMFNTSNSHVAEMMIQGSYRGITDMFKILKHNERADAATVEFAKELMDFEEKSVQKWREYL